MPSFALQSPNLLGKSRSEPRDAETVLLLYDEHTIASVDKGARVIVVTPPEGLLE